MFKKLAAGLMLAAFITAANGSVLANGNDGEKNRAKAETQKPLKGITYETNSSIKQLQEHTCRASEKQQAAQTI